MTTPENKVTINQLKILAPLIAATIQNTIAIKKVHAVDGGKDIEDEVLAEWLKLSKLIHSFSETLDASSQDGEEQLLDLWRRLSLQ